MKTWTEGYLRNKLRSKIKKATVSPRVLFVKAYNDYSKKINESLKKCEQRFGGPRLSTQDQNKYCYASAVAKHTPSLVSDLKYAAEHKCHDNESCKAKLLAMAKQYHTNITKARQQREKLKKVI